MKLSLEEFIKTEKENLEKFKIHVETKCKENPDVWPSDKDYEYGDWTDAFISFVDSTF